MRIYKRIYRDRAGVNQQTSRWYFDLRDPGDRGARPRPIPLFKDKGASDELAKKLLKLADFRSAGEPPDVPIRGWLAAMPKDVRRIVEDLGLAGSETMEGHRELAAHLSDYEKSMKADGRAARHISWTVSQVQRVITGAEFTYWSNVTAEKIKFFLATLLVGENAIKSRSYNGYIVAFKSFTNWAVKNGRLSSSPLATLHKRVQTDETERRALTLDEARLLLAVTQNAPDDHGMPGPERALVYRLALETGLRAGELQSLRRSSFELTGKEPVVKVAPDKTKNKKTARIHLNAETAAALLAHLDSKLPAAHAFKLPDSTHTAEMFRADCAAGRAAWIAAAPEGRQRLDRASGSFLAETDEAGRVLVFHSLRHTRGVWLFEHFGASPREVQELMRVSSIALVDRYARSFKVGGRNFADRSPNLAADQSSEIAAAVEKTSTGQRDARTA